MRALSKSFLHCLKSGFLSKITERVKCDHDLSLEIRNGYINVYYKGNSMLKLRETNYLSTYKAEIHKKFLEGINLPLEVNESTIHEFISNIPLLKENINRQGSHSLELEYEQMIIRANNFEPRNNTEYFIVDRQYAVGKDRFDLTGIYWDRNRRRRNQEVPVCLMEIKFAQNKDIRDVHEQLARYYEAIKNNAADFAEGMECVFRQKLELQLYNQESDRLEAMKTLNFSRDLKDFQFILVLVDYNQNSTRLNLDNLKKLLFADQVKVFHSGFGMWQQNVSSI